MGLKRLKEHLEYMAKNEDFTEALIFREFEEISGLLNERDIEMLLDVASDAYYNLEYSTPTGIGMCIWEMLYEGEGIEDFIKECVKENDYNKLHERFESSYMFSNWQ